MCHFNTILHLIVQESTTIKFSRRYKIAKIKVRDPNDREDNTNANE